AQRGADNRGAVVRAIPPDRRRLPVLGGADETCDDGHDAVAMRSRDAFEQPASSRVGLLEVHVRVRELIVGDDEVARVDERGGMPLSARRYFASARSAFRAASIS